MGTPRGEFTPDFGSSTREEPPAGHASNPAQPGGSGRSSQLIVSVPEEAGPDEYHTSRLCSAYPVPAESMTQAEAVDHGHTFCWTCFELEMRALADR